MHDFKNWPELTNAQMDFYYFESPHKQITRGFFATCVKVHDGDTITVRTNFRDFDFPIRLSYIDAPELNEPQGIESREWLKDRIIGKTIDVLINPADRVGKWGRILGVIMSDGMNINQESLMQRNAVAFGIQDFIPDFMGKELRREKWLSA